MRVYNPNNLPTIDIRKIKPLQGELKDLTEANYNKLKRSIERHGFFESIAVWKKDGELYLADGHQRQRVITKEGWTEEVPMRIVEAETLEEAIEKLLLLSSQIGTVTQEGFDTLTVNLPQLALENINFDALQFVSQESLTENKEIDPENLLSANTEQCPRCKFEFDCKNKSDVPI